MRIKNILTTFADFNWDHLAMNEQLFEDYKSKYLDLYDKVKSDHQKEKVSILEDVDFELELIHRDEINVAYIIQLLNKTEIESTKRYFNKPKRKYLTYSIPKHIYAVNENLIEKFIQENLPVIEDPDDIPQEFEKFWNAEQQKAFNQFVRRKPFSRKNTITH